MDVDWAPPTPKVISVFNVLVTRDRNWRKPHYPAYEIDTDLVGSAFSLECAERLVREVVEKERTGGWPQDLHSIRIVERQVGELYNPYYGALSEYVYDKEGRLLDKRTSPKGENWKGRAPGEYRFQKGDLCEILLRDKVVLGIVRNVPPSVENASKMGFDETDDSYTVQISRNEYSCHIDALKIFKPSFKIAAQTERKLRRICEEKDTLWMRNRIANTTAEAHLRMILEEMGWEADITLPSREGDSFGLIIKGVPGFPAVLRLETDQKKAQNHMGRVRFSFLRLAGEQPPGRGYRLKRVVDYMKKPIKPETWKF